MRFKQHMRSNTPLLDTVTNYIVKRKGKQVRPVFVMLSARLFGSISESTYTAASLLEILHTATLVHDDVVDDSYMRRGFFSVNALWKNKIAVLVGDYLLAKGLLLSIDNNEFRLLQILSNTIREMSEGELLQLEKARRLDISEDIYFQIIRQKTASLIASACACGAASVKASEEQIQQAYAMGEKVGIAFQIKDDLLDFGDSKTGKPRGVDIKERKMTLPIIYTLQNCDRSLRTKIIGIIKNENYNSEKVNWVIEVVRERGGIDYARSKMQAIKAESLQMLAAMPDGDAREALGKLIEFTINRQS